MAVAIKSVTVATSTTATVSVTTSESPSTTAIGDVVLIFHGNDFYDLTNMPTPTATGSPAVSAVSNGTADAGSNLAHIKAYTYTVNTSGAQTISVTETGAGDEEKMLVAFVLSGVDSASPIDGGSSGAAGATGAAATSFVAPAVTPSGTNAFLICVTNTGGGDTTGPYTPPSGMTEQYDSAITNFAYSGASQQLAASGSTGTKTFTSGTSARWAAVSVAMKTGTGAAPTTPEQYAASWLLVPPGNFSPASPRSFPFPSLGSSTITPPPAVQTGAWFTKIGDTTTPELIVSAEDWGIVVNGTVNNGGNYQTTYDQYFTARAAQGYNGVEVSMFNFDLLTGGNHTGPDADGNYPWNTNSTDPTNPANTTFWAKRDAFFTTAASYGFRVFMNLTSPWIGISGASQMFLRSWTNAQWTAYGNFLGARYTAASYPNIMWIFGDDYFGDLDSQFSLLLTAMRNQGATQPVSVQNYQETSSRLDIFNGAVPTWGSTHAEYNWGYSYNVSYDVVEKMGNEADPIPYLFADGTFLNTGGITGYAETNQDYGLMRHLVWWALSSGSKGFQVGDNDIFPWDVSSLGQVTAKTFYTQQVPAIAAMFRSLPYWHLLEADTSNQLLISGRNTHASPLTSGGSGGQYLNNADTYVTGSYIQSGDQAGQLAVIYLSHTGTVGIDQSKMVAGYKAFWVDPANGRWTSTAAGSSYTSSGTNSVGDQDWVLVLMDSALAPGSQLPIIRRPFNGLIIRSR